MPVPELTPLLGMLDPLLPGISQGPVQMHPLLWPVLQTLRPPTCQQTQLAPTPNLYSTNPTESATISCLTFQTQLLGAGKITYLQ